jgi:hypothetical protein
MEFFFEELNVRAMYEFEMSCLLHLKGAEMSLKMIH